MGKRIHIQGVRRREIDTDLLAYVYFLEGKRIRKQRREREELEKSKRREREGRTGDRHER